MSDVGMSARPPKRQTFVVGTDMLPTCQSTCLRHRVKTCRHRCQHDTTIMSAADMLAPCWQMLAKKLLWVLFFRLNQHTTIKYCDVAVLLGDDGGAAAFREVCWAVVEGCRDGVRQRRWREMRRDMTGRQDSSQQLDIMPRRDSMTWCDDEMHRDGKTHEGTWHRQYSTQLHDNQPNKAKKVLKYVSGSLLCRTGHTCQAKIGDISTRPWHVDDMSPTFPAKVHKWPRTPKPEPSCVCITV